jgi:hypothetical protein
MPPNHLVALFLPSQLVGWSSHDSRILADRPPGRGVGRGFHPDRVGEKRFPANFLKTGLGLGERASLLKLVRVVATWRSSSPTTRS